jgi:hypothetical protein
MDPNFRASVSFPVQQTVEKTKIPLKMTAYVPPTGLFLQKPINGSRGRTAGRLSNQTKKLSRGI